jgi:hypothetical protein
MFQEGPVSHEACQLSHMLKVTASALCNVIGVLVKCEAVWLACSALGQWQEQQA